MRFGCGHWRRAAIVPLLAISVARSRHLHQHAKVAYGKGARISRHRQLGRDRVNGNCDVVCCMLAVILFDISSFSLFSSSLFFLPLPPFLLTMHLLSLKTRHSPFVSLLSCLMYSVLPVSLLSFFTSLLLFSSVSVMAASVAIPWADSPLTLIHTPQFETNKVGQSLFFSNGFPN